jgi:hypothetical protein
MHSTLSINDEELLLVVDAAATDAAGVILAETVGIRRAAPVEEIAIAVFITLGRAVAANAAGTTQKTANKLIVFLRNAIPLLHFYYFILS